jgi:hypothetical protein
MASSALGIQLSGFATSCQISQRCSKDMLTFPPGPNGHSNQQRSYRRLRSIWASQLRQGSRQRAFRTYQRRSFRQDYCERARLRCGKVQVRDLVHGKLHGAERSDHSTVVCQSAERRSASELKEDWRMCDNPPLLRGVSKASHSSAS